MKIKAAVLAMGVFLTSVIMSAASAGSESSQTPSVSKTNTQAASEAVDQKEIVVYVTKSGTKYHLAGCRYLKSDSVPMALKDAAARYTPCSTCHPPALEVGNQKASVASQAGASQNPPQKTTQATQGNPTGESTATGMPIYTGPRGGKYHYSKNGNKVYEKRK